MFSVCAQAVRVRGVAHAPAMHRVLSPLAQLRYEGAQVLYGNDVAVVGRDKTFQCLVMEERVRAAKTQCTTGQSPPVYASPGVRDVTIEEFEERMASVPPPELFRPSRRSASPYTVEAEKETTDAGCQVGRDLAVTTDTGVTTIERMEQGNTRDTIIEANQKVIEELKEEEARLEAMVSGTSAEIIDYFRKPEQHFLLRHAEREKEERRAHAIFEATSAVNERQFLREQLRVDKRTQKRGARFGAVQERIETIKDRLRERGLHDAAMCADGSPGGRSSSATSHHTRLESIHRLITPSVSFAAQRRMSTARGASAAPSLTRKMSRASSIAPSASPSNTAGQDPPRARRASVSPSGAPNWHEMKQ